MCCMLEVGRHAAILPPPSCPVLAGEGEVGGRQGSSVHQDRPMLLQQVASPRQEGPPPTICTAQCLGSRGSSQRDLRTLGPLQTSNTIFSEFLNPVVPHFSKNGYPLNVGKKIKQCTKEKSSFLFAWVTDIFVTFVVSRPQKHQKLPNNNNKNYFIFHFL